VGSLTSLFKGKAAQTAFKVIWVLVILLGLYNVSNSYNVVKTKFVWWNVQQIDAQLSDETIQMTYTEQGLTPSTINLQVGKTYSIVIDAQTTVYGCMSTIYLPGLDDNIQSIKKWNKITFVVKPTKSWTYEFDCAMWLSHQAKVIVE
jgi:hypothetical protein